MIGWAAFAHELRCRRARGRSSRSSTCGSCRTSSRSRGSIAMTTGAGGMKMLSTVDRDGLLTKANIGLCSMVLVPVSVSPTMVGLAGPVYLWGALVIGIAQLWLSIRFVRCHSREDARRVFVSRRSSICPLCSPCLLVDTFLIGGLSRTLNATLGHRHWERMPLDIPCPDEALTRRFGDRKAPSTGVDLEVRRTRPVLRAARPQRWRQEHDIPDALDAAGAERAARRTCLRPRRRGASRTRSGSASASCSRSRASTRSCASIDNLRYQPVGSTACGGSALNARIEQLLERFGLE
jgi:hypothetical protein